MSVAALRAAVAAVEAEIGNMQGAIGAAKDSGDMARGQLAAIFDGSNREEAAEAQALVTAAGELCGEAFTMTFAAVELLQQYMASR